MKGSYWVIGIVVILLIGYGAYSVASTPPQTLAPLQAWEPATLEASIGKPILLEFMNPACIHCQRMASIVTKLYGNFSQNVKFISLSDGSPSDTQKFIQDYGQAGIMAYDSTGQIFGQYGVTGTPTFVIIDGSGHIANTFVGEVSYGTLAAALQQVMNQ